MEARAESFLKELEAKHESIDVTKVFNFRMELQKLDGGANYGNRLNHALRLGKLLTNTVWTSPDVLTESMLIFSALVSQYRAAQMEILSEDSPIVQFLSVCAGHSNDKVSVAASYCIGALACKNEVTQLQLRPCVVGTAQVILQYVENFGSLSVYEKDKIDVLTSVLIETMADPICDQNQVLVAEILGDPILLHMKAVKENEKDVEFLNCFMPLLVGVSMKNASVVLKCWEKNFGVHAMKICSLLTKRVASTFLSQLQPEFPALLINALQVLENMLYALDADCSPEVSDAQMNTIFHPDMPYVLANVLSVTWQKFEDFFPVFPRVLHIVCDILTSFPGFLEQRGVEDKLFPPLVLWFNSKEVLAKLSLEDRRIGKRLLDLIIPAYADNMDDDQENDRTLQRSRNTSGSWDLTVLEDWTLINYFDRDEIVRCWLEEKCDSDADIPSSHSISPTTASSSEKLNRSMVGGARLQESACNLNKAGTSRPVSTVGQSMNPENLQSLRQEKSIESKESIGEGLRARDTSSFPELEPPEKSELTPPKRHQGQKECDKQAEEAVTPMVMNENDGDGQYSISSRGNLKSENVTETLSESFIETAVKPVKRKYPFADVYPSAQCTPRDNSVLSCSKVGAHQEDDALKSKFSKMSFSGAGKNDEDSGPYVMNEDSMGASEYHDASSEIQQQNFMDPSEMKEQTDFISDDEISSVESFQLKTVRVAERRKNKETSVSSDTKTDQELSEEFWRQQVMDEWKEEFVRIPYPQRTKKPDFSKAEMVCLTVGRQRFGNDWSLMAKKLPFDKSRTPADLRKKWHAFQKEFFPCSNPKHENTKIVKSQMLFGYREKRLSTVDLRRLLYGVKIFGANWNLILKSFHFAWDITAKDLEANWNDAEKQLIRKSRSWTRTADLLERSRRL